MGSEMTSVVVQVALLALMVKVTSGCGGYLVGSGNITSPNFPNYYPAHSLCTWTLAADPGKYLLLRLLYIDTQEIYDYVNVSSETTMMERDRHTYFNQLSGYIYNRTRDPKTLLVASNATVTFVSDSYYAAVGFQMEYTSVNATPFIEPFTDCGGDLVGSGNITSPNYPNVYPMNSRCTWMLQAYPGQYISIRVINFLTERDHDYVLIYNGSETGNPYLLKYSGNNVYNPKLLVNGPIATVHFFSDNSVSSTGFQIEYASYTVSFSACGGEINGSGEIVSPNFPDYYPHNVNCTWRLRATTGYSVSLQVIEMNKESYFDPIQVFSSGYFFNDKVFDDYPYHASYSYFLSTLYIFYQHVENGVSADIYRTKPAVIGSEAVVVFTSDSTVSYTGFRIRFDSISMESYSECFRILNKSSTITSPNFPHHYPNNSHCAWTLQTTPDRTFLLRVVEFNTEEKYDVLYFQRTSSNTLLPPERFSGSNPSRFNGKPLEFGTKGYIYFNSDHSSSSTGFRIEVENVKKYPLFADCGGTLHSSGKIQSPNYPDQYYNNTLCKWELTADAGHWVSLRIIQFNTEEREDYVTISNGTRFREDNYSGSYNLTLKSIKLLFPWRNATVTFRSDNSVTDSGFWIEFQSADITPFTACGEELHGLGNITSPNFPRNYPDNSKCTWVITADPGKAVLLRLIKFSTESGHDIVHVFNANQTVESNASYTYTGDHGEREKPLILGSRATVVFTSDSTISSSGFRIEFNSAYTPLPEGLSSTTTRPEKTTGRCNKIRRNNVTLTVPATSDGN